jgi:hypothetical protein
MDPLSIFKIILSIIEVVIETYIAVIVIKKNPKYWLHRFFGIFFIVTSIGFLTYIAYHFILGNVGLAISFVIVTQILFNTGFACLLMTWLIMKESEVEAMKLKYLLLVGALWFISIIGYVIWPPTLDMPQYALGIVHSLIPTNLNIFSNLYRIGIMLLAILSYYKWSKKVDDPINKRKMKFFYIGMSMALGGILCIFLAGIDPAVEFLFTITGIVLFLLGTILITRALVKLS